MKDFRIFEAAFWRTCLSWELIANWMTREDAASPLRSRSCEGRICDGRSKMLGGTNVNGAMDAGFWNLSSYLWQILGVGRIRVYYQGLGG